VVGACGLRRLWWRGVVCDVLTDVVMVGEWRGRYLSGEREEGIYRGSARRRREAVWNLVLFSFVLLFSFHPAPFSVWLYLIPFSSFIFFQNVLFFISL
jgi:hypothetical protein